MNATVPLVTRAGVCGYSIVDAEDYELASRFRWRKSAGGYARANGKREGQWITVYLHRLILGLEYGDKREADHINGDRLDNRRANLRIVTQAQNMQNRPAHAGGGSSRFRGVHWDNFHQKWRAVVRDGARNHHVGYFADEVQAARAAEAFRSVQMPFAQPDPELRRAA